MPGPYAKGQWATPCGCYYPDVTRIGDDVTTTEVILYCVYHEEYRMKGSPELIIKSERLPVPPEEWRERERQRIRKKEKEQLDNRLYNKE